MGLGLMKQRTPRNRRHLEGVLTGLLQDFSGQQIMDALLHAEQQKAREKAEAEQAAKPVLEAFNGWLRQVRAGTFYPDKQHSSEQAEPPKPTEWDIREAERRRRVLVADTRAEVWRQMGICFPEQPIPTELYPHTRTLTRAAMARAMEASGIAPKPIKAFRMNDADRMRPCVTAILQCDRERLRLLAARLMKLKPRITQAPAQRAMQARRNTGANKVVAEKLNQRLRVYAPLLFGYHQQGRIYVAARLLNEAAVPSARGAEWRRDAVRKVVVQIVGRLVEDPAFLDGLGAGDAGNWSAIAEDFRAFGTTVTQTEPDGII